MKKTLGWIARIALILLGVISLFAVGGTLAFYLRSRPLEPVNPVAAQLNGLSCDLWDDPQGVSHARADQKIAALACIGYLHGRDRAWQMDFFKRTWEGRKSEILGPSEIKGDFTMRLMGLAARAESLFEKMSPEMQSWFWAYSYGVNRGSAEALAHGSYEFRELGNEPESWQPWDSVALMLLQAFDQTKESFIRQLDETAFLSDWGKDAPALFARANVPWETTILKKGEQEPVRPRSAAGSPSANSGAGARVDRNRLRQFKLAAGGGIGQGSNNWVIAPGRSATGHAWLANDPHLELKHPPFWYWLHVQAPELDAIGASLPGMPGIASGANRHLAWGLTNSYLNVSRLTFVPEGDLVAGASSERPVIWFKFGPLRLPMFFKSFSRTHEGWPILPVETPAGQALVLRWTGFELVPEDFRGIFELSAAKSAEEADRALSHFGVPSWNFVFADDQGKIGYRAVGRVPANGEEVPFGIAKMSLEELRRLPAFSRFLTPAEMPHLFRPARGFIATANNRQWPEPTALHIGHAHSEGFRAFRIEELLLATPKQGLDSIGKIQCDVQAVDARFLLPGLLKAVGEPRDARERSAIAALRSWDGYEAGLDCKACPVFQRWLDRLLTDQDLDDTALYHKLQEPGDEFAPVVRMALTDALDDLRLGPDSALPLWKELHLNAFPHLAGRDRFKTKPISTPGDDQSVNPGSSEWDEGVFRHTTGASQRLIVELTSPPRVYSVLAGSNADLEGRELSAPGSEWQRWLNCQQQQREFPLDWSKVQARKLDL